MTKDGPQVCRPCRENVHLECDGTKIQPCHCLVCLAQKIGDAIMGDGAGDYRRRRNP